MRITITAPPDQFTVAVEDWIAGLKVAGGRAITGASRRGRSRLQVDTTTGLGPRVANAWRAKSYPRDAETDKPRDSVSPAALIWTRAPNIVDAFNKGVPIRPRSGKWLAIPTANAEKVKGERVNPASFAAAGIKLQFVPPKGRRTAKLVMPGRLTRGGRVRVLTGGGRRAGTASLIMFILIRYARVQKLLDLQRRATEIGNDLESSYVRELDRAI